MARRPGERDYRDGQTKDEAGKLTSKARPVTGVDHGNRRWWDFKGKECAQAVTTAISFLQKQQEARLRNMVVNARLYGNVGTLGTSSSAFGRLLSTTPSPKKYATMNATGSALDTMVAHIGEQKPRPFYLSSGGNYKEQRQAKKLNQWTDGVFYECGTYRKISRSFKHAGVWGDGWLNVFKRGGKIAHELVIGAEIWVDEVEAQYGFPRNMHRVKVVDRDEAIGTWPKKEAEILEASRAIATTTGGIGSNISDMVTIAESWHLGAMDDNGDLNGGKNCVTLVGSGVLLEDPEDWAHDFFPVVKLPWNEPLVGYYAQGLCEAAKGKQMWLNELMYTVQRAMRLTGTIKVAMEHGAKLVDEHINNEIGAVLKHAPGKPPVFFTAAPVDPSFFTEIRQAIADIFQEAGVSELSAGNIKPAGLDSKPSLREFKDTQNERHKTKAELVDEFALQVARVSRELAKDMPDYTVRVPGASGFRKISVKDLGTIKDEAFVFQCFPVSQLPRDPAGRTQTVQEWVQAGWLTPRQGRKLMDFPDLQAANTLADAQEELVTEVLDAIVDDGEFSPPEPTDDLALDKETVIHYIQLYRRLDLEPEKMTLLRKWSQQVDALIARSVAPAMQSSAGPSTAAVPQAQAAPAPQSQLLPQKAA